MCHSNNIWGQVHRTDAHLPEFEVRFDRWSNYHGCHEIKTDFFRANSKEEVVEQVHCSYGALVDILFIEEFV